MRINCKIIGNTNSFHLDPVLERGVLWDTQSTKLFAYSLYSSLSREMVKLSEMFNEELSTNQAYQRSAKSISRNCEKERFGYVLIDIYSERIKGIPHEFCKISIEDDYADVRTKNILPEIARFLYKTVWLLKKTTPPGGMETLRNINIIRNYNDPRAKTHELYVEDGTVKEREKTKKN